MLQLLDPGPGDAEGAALAGDEVAPSEPTQERVDVRVRHAAAPDWRECVRALRRAPRPRRRRPGLRLLHRRAGRRFRARSCDALRRRTGVADWVGTRRHSASLATGAEYQDEPAMAAMVADLDSAPSAFSRARAASARRRRTSPWCTPIRQAPDVAGLVADMSAKVASGYPGRRHCRARAGARCRSPTQVLSGGLSGVAFAPQVAVATRLTQGCSPYRPAASASPSARTTSSPRSTAGRRSRCCRKPIEKLTARASWSASRCRARTPATTRCATWWESTRAAS